MSKLQRRKSPSNSPVRLRSLGLLILLLTQWLSASAQLYDLTQILYSQVDPLYVVSPQVHAMNDQGDILASMGSIHEDDKTTLILITRKGNSDFRVEQLGEYSNCQVVDIDNEGRILITATTPGGSKQEALLIEVNGRKATPVIASQQADSRGVRLKHNMIAINGKYKELSNKSKHQDNPYRNHPNAINQIPTSAEWGYVYQIEGDSHQFAGFPTAQWYNLSSMVTDINVHGHSCGQSEGYTTGANFASPYPFLATEDSVYRLLDGYQGSATAVNDQDQVVGTWKDPMTGRDYGFFYDQSLLSANDSDWLDMLDAIPTAINNEAIVTGHRSDSAFIMIDRKYVPAKEVVAGLPDNWSILDIADLNEKNEIVGTAVVGGRRKLFLAKIVHPDLNDGGE